MLCPHRVSIVELRADFVHIKKENVLLALGFNFTLEGNTKYSQKERHSLSILWKQAFIYQFFMCAFMIQIKIKLYC